MLDDKRARGLSLGNNLKAAFDYTTEQLKANELLFHKNGFKMANILNISFLADMNSTVADNFPLVGHADDVAKIRMYIKNRFLIYLRYNMLKHIMKNIKASYVPYTVFKTICHLYNTHLVSSVLKGVEFPLGRLGSLSIIRKPRLFVMDEKDGVPTKNINWHLSLKRKEELIAQGITPYNKETNPDGVKWFVYHDEPFTYWFRWIPSRIRHRKLIKFMPTNFINTPDRDHKSILESAKSVDDIINSDKLGNMNKLQTLVKFAPGFTNVYTLIENIHERN
jgi:hypothetical protein